MMEEMIRTLYPSTFTLDEQGSALKKNQKDREIQVKRSVEYIHPKGRYVTVRFTFAEGTGFCESFLLDRSGKLRV